MTNTSFFPHQYTNFSTVQVFRCSTENLALAHQKLYRIIPA
jgi:hypothetical protein